MQKHKAQFYLLRNAGSTWESLASLLYCTRNAAAADNIISNAFYFICSHYLILLYRFRCKFSNKLW